MRSWYRGIFGPRDAAVECWMMYNSATAVSSGYRKKGRRVSDRFEGFGGICALVSKYAVFLASSAEHGYPCNCDACNTTMLTACIAGG